MMLLDNKLIGAQWVRRKYILTFLYLKSTKTYLAFGMSLISFQS